MSEPRPRAVVITGGSGALAPVVAATFVAAGYRAALLGRSPPPGAPPERRADRLYAVGAGDLADPAAAEAALASAADVLQGCDVLVNVAGSFRWERIAGGSTATWETLYASNLKTALNMSRAAIQRLAAGGRIINIGAAASAQAAAGMGAYAAAKSAVARLTESLAAELRDRDITVNAVLPNVIDTPRNRADMPTTDRSAWTSPAAIADVILFLASPAARAISGALLPVTRPA